MTTTATRIVTAALLAATSLAVAAAPQPAAALPGAPDTPGTAAGGSDGWSGRVGEDGAGRFEYRDTRPGRQGNPGGGNPGRNPGGNGGRNGGGDGGDEDEGCPDPATLPNGVACAQLEMEVEQGFGAAPQPPTPDEVAQELLVQVVTTFSKPEPVTDPALGTPAVLEVPTFVAIANWVDQVTDSDCDDVTGTVCVTLTATPRLEFDPGEPGAAVVACQGAGTRFDPDGPPPRQQAEGACAHTYTRRTGTAGRPAHWPGEVRTIWTFEWVLNGGEDSGTLPPVTLTNDVPR
ncbi:MAG TPA: hypothetical protein VIL36_01570, partial [Acidimicrobiales bacterium]